MQHTVKKTQKPKDQKPKNNENKKRNNPGAEKTKATKARKNFLIRLSFYFFKLSLYSLSAQWLQHCSLHGWSAVGFSFVIMCIGMKLEICVPTCTNLAILWPPIGSAPDVLHTSAAKLCRRSLEKDSGVQLNKGQQNAAH